MRNNFKIPVVLNISDESVKSIRDKIKSSDKIKSITVRMEATHSGIVNGNNWFYVNDGMARGAKSFIRPIHRPVTYEHMEDSAVLGRVIGAKYVDYNISPDTIMDSSSKDFHKSVQEYVSSSKFKDSEYKGTGHIELIAKITDSDAIEKVLNREFIGVSVGGKTNRAICSICGVDKKSSHCKHEAGNIYDSKKCFYIGGTMTFDHVTYTSTPADKNATSTIIQDSEKTNSFLDILDFEITQKDKPMKLKLTELDGNISHLEAYAESLGIKDAIQEPQEDKSVSDFLFGETKTYSIADALSASLVMKFLKESVEEDADFKDALQIVEEKLGELGVEDYDKVIQDAVAANTIKETDTKETQTVDIDQLADTIVSKFKDSLVIQDGFQGTRIKALQSENRDLIQEISGLKTRLKDSLVTQISKIENIQDSDKIEKLKQRTIASLEDKLEDLLSYEVENKDIKDSKEKVLEKDSVDLSDASDNDSGAEENIKDSNANPDNKNDGKESEVTLTDSEIKTAYKKAMMEGGLGAGPLYLKSLKEQGIIPADYQLSK